MKNWYKKLKEKDGWITLVVIFMLSTILPIFLFFFVEYNYLYGQKDQAQSIADNIASSAVRSIDETQLMNKQIVISESEAQDVANKLFIQSYELEDSMTVSANTMLRETPIMKVYVLNITDPNGSEFTTDEGYTFTIRKPSVIVYTSVKPKGVFFNRIVNLQSYSMYEAILPPKNNNTTPVNPGKGNGNGNGLGNGNGGGNVTPNTTVQDLQFRKVYLPQ